MSRSPFIRIQRFQKQSWNRPKFFMGPAQIFIARNGDVSFHSHKRTAKLKRKGNPMRLICAWALLTIAVASMHAQENSMPESPHAHNSLGWTLPARDSNANSSANTARHNAHAWKGACIKLPSC